MGQNVTLVKQFGNPTFTSLITDENTTVGGNLSVLGTATISGSLTAQSLIVVTTNVITGSTIFGSVPTNTHQFTGSIFNTVSISTAGSFTGSGAGLTSIPNSALTNRTISGINLGSNLATLTIGTGLSGTSYNGSSAVTITNSGVTSNVAGTGITVSGATGAVTITNSGVTSIVAGTGISINQGTGAVTVTNTITNTNQLTNGAGFITSAGTSADSSLLNGISAVNLYNNMGASHNTRTSFDTSSPSYGFGYRYVQGSTNGPGTGGSQFYSWYIGLGSEYPSTGAGSYGAMFAVDRNTTGPYLSVRYNESNTFTGWRKIYAGYADSAPGSGITGNLTISGAITATGDITAYYSDMRLKTNIRTIDSALNKVMQLGGYYYNPNDLAIELGASQDRDERVGVMAQEVMEVLPHAIKDAPFDKTGTYKTVQYDKLVPLLIQAMKEQQSQIEELKTIINVTR